ncbi:MAG: flagellar hook-basal body complex protein [Peptostreptococcaceae bacterium]
MYNLLQTSKTGMQATQIRIDTISNNMVNAQTVGYKKLENSFLDTYTETLDKRVYPNNNEDNITGTGVKISESVRRYDQGSLKATDIDTDMAIEGNGFFKVTNPEGNDLYTRNGSFKLDADGRIVDDNGNFLEVIYDDASPVQDVNLSNGILNIKSTGEVFLDEVKIGKINLYEPEGTNDLLSGDNSLFELNDGAFMQLANDSLIHQGHVEMSNVRLEQEMTNLILAQRAFQFNSKGIQAADEMWSMANNLQR